LIAPLKARPSATSSPSGHIGELAFHFADSSTYRAFCRIDPLATPPSHSAPVVERIQPATLVAMNHQLVTSPAEARGMLQRASRSVILTRRVGHGLYHAMKKWSYL
jgi:hypothetical protein